MPDIEWNKKFGQQIKEWPHPKNSTFYYGLQWGNYEAKGLSYWLRKIIFNLITPGNPVRPVKYFLLPYVNSDSVVLEIGPGGGRYTQYLLSAKQLILVELNPEFFPYLTKRFKGHVSKFRFYRTKGYELHGIDTSYVDFVVSFGTFVHIEPEGIYEYLKNIKRVLKPGGIVAIQYANKRKKEAQRNLTFSDMNPDRMEELIRRSGLELIEDNFSKPIT